MRFNHITKYAAVPKSKSAQDQVVAVQNLLLDAKVKEKLGSNAYGGSADKDWGSMTEKSFNAAVALASNLGITAWDKTLPDAVRYMTDFKTKLNATASATTTTNSTKLSPEQEAANAKQVTDWKRTAQIVLSKVIEIIAGEAGQKFVFDREPRWFQGDFLREKVRLAAVIASKGGVQKFAEWYSNSSFAKITELEDIGSGDTFKLLFPKGLTAGIDTSKVYELMGTNNSIISKLVSNLMYMATSKDYNEEVQKGKEILKFQDRASASASASGRAGATSKADDGQTRRASKLNRLHLLAKVANRRELARNELKKMAAVGDVPQYSITRGIEQFPTTIVDDKFKDWVSEVVIQDLDSANARNEFRDMYNFLEGLILQGAQDDKTNFGFSYASANNFEKGAYSMYYPYVFLMAYNQATSSSLISDLEERLGEAQGSANSWQMIGDSQEAAGIATSIDRMLQILRKVGPPTTCIDINGIPNGTCSSFTGVTPNPTPNPNPTPTPSPTPTPTPSPTPRPRRVSVLRLRKLLNEVGYPNNVNVDLWDADLESAFGRCYVDWAVNLFPAKEPQIDKTLPIDWVVEGPILGFTPDVAGAEKFVEMVKAKKQGVPSVVPPTVPTNQDKPSREAAIDGLAQLFTLIQNRVIKVDLQGIDTRFDTKNFRGVISGLGGPEAAAKTVINEAGFNQDDIEYCAKFAGMSSSEMAGAASNSDSLRKAYGFFWNIYLNSTRSFLGIRINTARQVAERVKEYRATGK